MERFNISKHPINPSWLVMVDLFDAYCREVKHKNYVLDLVGGDLSNVIKIRAIMQTNKQIATIKQLKELLNENINKAYDRLITYESYLKGDMGFEERRQFLISKYPA